MRENRVGEDSRTGMNTMSDRAMQFKKRVEALVEEVRSFAEPHEWVTKPYPKKFRDADQSIYMIPALFLQKGPVRVLLDPVAYDVPGSEGVVDLYLMPTYDDMASLYFENGHWLIRYAYPATSMEQAQLVEADAILLDEVSINQVLDSIAANAESPL
ncbi:hypothetical protein BH10PLA2_BH10PLA2_14860 [soil metagenome]